MFLSGIFNACRCKTEEKTVLNKYVEDPRQKLSGMTTNLIPSHPACGHPLPRTKTLWGRLSGARGAIGGFTLVEPLVNIGQVKPDASRKHTGKLSGSRLTYKGSFGFTLIELLVVVLIIGILAAVALPQYQKTVNKARGAEVLVAMDSLEKAAASFYLENGTYTGFRADTSPIAIPELTYFGYVNGADGPSGQYKYSSNSFVNIGSAGGKLKVAMGTPGNTYNFVLQFDKGKLTDKYCTGDFCTQYFNNCNWKQVGTTSQLGCYLN